MSDYSVPHVMPTGDKTDVAHVEEAKNANLGDVDSDQSLDPMEEARITKAILWKLDTRMLPMLAVLFLFSFLDRCVSLSSTQTLACLRP